MRLLHDLWRDECGFIFSTELLLIATIVVIGLIVGLVALRNATVWELRDMAGAVGGLNQSYYYPGLANFCGGAFTAGGRFCDRGDDCDRHHVHYRPGYGNYQPSYANYQPGYGNYQPDCGQYESGRGCSGSSCGSISIMTSEM